MIVTYILGILLYSIFLPFRFLADGEVRHRFIADFLNTGMFGQMKYALTGSIFSLPLAILDNVVRVDIFQVRYNFIIFLIASLLLYQSLKQYIDKSILILFLLLLTFGSMFPAHLMEFYGEVFSVLLMGVGIIYMEQKKELLGWGLMVLSVANLPATLLPLLGICVYKIIRQKSYRIIILPLVALCVIALDAKLRTPRTITAFTTYLYNDLGGPNVLPYSGLPGFSFPLMFGLLSELFSFGKGLLFFAPGLLFIPHVLSQVPKKIKQILILWMIYLLGVLLVYAKWWAWYGGWFWGPRFLLFASIPASLALAFMLRDTKTKFLTKTIALTIAGWSLWVGVNGIVFNQKGLEICQTNHFSLEYLCWYTPEFSVLFHPFVQTPTVNPIGWVMIGVHAIVWILIIWKVLVKKSLNHQRLNSLRT